MVLADFMKAAVLAGHGGLDKLVIYNDLPVPKPKPDEVLIEVGACGINNTDVNTRIGWYSKLATFPCAYSTAEHMLDRIRLQAGEKILIPGASVPQSAVPGRTLYHFGCHRRAYCRVGFAYVIFNRP